VTLDADQPHHLSGLLLVPPRAIACYVLAHGAGAGMTHPFMEAVAIELAARRIATLRYQFPYMQRGARRPDPPSVAEAAVRSAVAGAARLTELPLIAGGKSFGGRMTSQAQAASPLPGVRGLVFLGFPLHTAGRPASDRGRHLAEVHVPMLFLQGERDKLADQQLIGRLTAQLGRHATLRIFPHADHSFHVPARSGRTDIEVRRELSDALADWLDAAILRPVQM
jgi:predicted alpha/beta-hydrolase family hydrolase